MLFGAHCSTGGGVHMAFRKAEDIGAACLQIFVKNNMQWAGKAPKQSEISEFLTQSKNFKPGAVFGHAGYLINLGAPASANRDKSIASLIQELTFSEALGLPFLVLHPGAHLGAGEELGLDQIVAGLDQVFDATAGLRVRVALENTAGQGSCLGYKIEHMAAIFDRVKKPERLAVCLDTAHLLASGFDIRTPEGWEEVIRKVKALVGQKQVVAFHLNDSKTDLGSRVDRHEHIGKGKIGLEAFRHIANDQRFKSIPGCIETPKSKDLHEDVENLAVLKSLVNAAV